MEVGAYFNLLLPYLISNRLVIQCMFKEKRSVGLEKRQSWNGGLRSPAGHWG